MTEEELAQKPILTESQTEIAISFAEARSWKKSDETLSKEEIQQAAQSVIYDYDLAVWIMKSLDDFRMGLVVEKLKRQNHDR